MLARFYIRLCTETFFSIVLYGFENACTRCFLDFLSSSTLSISLSKIRKTTIKIYLKVFIKVCFKVKNFFELKKLWNLKSYFLQTGCPLFFFCENKLSRMDKYNQPKNIWETGQFFWFKVCLSIFQNRLYLIIIRWCWREKKGVFLPEKAFVIYELNIFAEINFHECY